MTNTYSSIKGLGFYVPDNVVTNDDLTQYMDTSDAWIQERTGIKQRRYFTYEKIPTPAWIQAAFAAWPSTALVWSRLPLT